MKKKFRRTYLLLSSVVIYLAHLPFSFAKSVNGANSTITVNESSPAKTVAHSISAAAALVYDSLRQQLPGLSKQAFNYAVAGLEKLNERGQIADESIISIADFSQPSSQKRLYVIDLKNFKVLFNTWVAHGRNSGKERATALSNRMSSNMSSPGFYVTGNTYTGNHGYSLRLEGVEKGINDNAFERAIVVHGAEYVNPALVKTQGYIGRSLGCPAVPVKLATPIIRTIKDGTCLFIYHPSVVGKSGLIG